MSVVQSHLSHLFPHAAQSGLRSVRRPFRPSADTGPYRLPHDVRDRLGTALAGYRNRDAAFSLAVFLGRFWSAPGRLERAFPIDRRALANRPDLRLTEAQVRGAIRALENAGFLNRVILGKGSRHKLANTGELHRKPMLFQFGSDYAVSFSMANKRTQKARERHSHARRTLTPLPVSQASTVFLAASAPKSPKNIISEAEKVLMGELKPKLPEPTSLNPHLEAALERWKRAAEGQGLFGSGQRDS